MFKTKKEKNQIIDLAEKLINDSGFSGILEEDFKKAGNTVEKQAFLIETLLYKYEYGSAEERFGLLEKIDKECRVLLKLMKERTDEKTAKEVFDEMLKTTDALPETKIVNVNGNEVKMKTFLCGEYFDGRDYNNVVAAAIYLNDEALYENLPVEGIWSCASNYGDLKMISVGKFDDPNDAFGYIDFMTGGTN